MAVDTGPGGRTRIGQLAAEIARLADTELSLSTFLNAYLERLREAVGAEAGAVWLVGDGGRLQVVCDHGWSRAGLDRDPATAAWHPGRVIAALRRSEAGVERVPGAAIDDPAAAERWLYLGPVRGPGAALALVELLRTGALEEEPRARLLQFVDDMGQHAARWFERFLQRAATAAGPTASGPTPSPLGEASSPREASSHREAAARRAIEPVVIPVPGFDAAPSNRVAPNAAPDRVAHPEIVDAPVSVRSEEFAARLEPTLLRLGRADEVAQVASVAANDGRVLLEVDRVGVATWRGKRVVVEAISGQEEIHRRADLVAALRRLLAAVLPTGDAFLFAGGADDVPEPLERVLADYLKESGARLLLIVPLFAPEPLVPSDRDPDDPRTRPAPPQVFGALVVERLADAEAAPGLRERSERFGGHVATALHRGLAQRRILFLPLWRRLGELSDWLFGTHKKKTIAALVGIATVVVALCVVPWEYRVEAEGRLMPVVQRPVFAPWDGEVASLETASGRRVSAGEALLRMKNEELHAQLVAARALRSEKQQLLSALRAELSSLVKAESPQEEIKLQGQMLETEVELEAAREEARILEEREAALVVRAPIDGVVVTFQLEQLLENRPVRRGEVLLEVMDAGGPWHLELEVPEERMGHVLPRFARDDATALPLEFVLATAVERTFAGHVTDLATRADAGKEGTVVEIRAAIADPAALPERRIGAEVRAKIDCGKRPLGYVLFGDVIDFVRKLLWI